MITIIRHRALRQFLRNRTFYATCCISKTSKMNLNSNSTLSAHETKQRNLSNFTWCFETSMEKEIGIVQFSSVNSKVNVMNLKNLQELVGSIEKLILKHPNLKGIVIMSKNIDCFSAGADIKVLSGIKTAEEGEKVSSEAQQILIQLKSFDIPIVAAISGHCVGAGLELALACSSSIGLNYSSTKLGFPEVRLGLLPGAGGCTQSFNKIGIKNSLTMILCGCLIGAAKAKQFGYLDLIVEPVGPGLESGKEASMQLLKNVAVEHALKLSYAKSTNPPLWLHCHKFNYYVGLWFANKFAQLSVSSQYEAPFKIMEVFYNFLFHPFNQSKQLSIESKAFGELAATKTSKNLIEIYNKRNEIKNKDYGVAQFNTKCVGIVGAGLMGAGITQVSALNEKLRVVCMDISEESLIDNYAKLKTSLDTHIKSKKLSSFQKDAILNETKFTNNIQDLKNCELIIETVGENLEAKKKLISQLELVTQPQTTIATNTSAIALKDIIRDSKRPENIVGMHYFSPVPRMELLEIVKHPLTSKETLARAVDVGMKQRKLCVVVNDCPGFFTTRVLFATLTEILMLLNEGVSPVTIDKQTQNFGFSVGNVSLIDYVGVDVCYQVAEYLRKEYSPRFDYVDIGILQELVEAGNLGKKSNKGFFIHSSLKTGVMKSIQTLSKLTSANLSVYPIISDEFQKLMQSNSHHTTSSLANSDEDVRMRLVCKLVNEAILAFQEGVLESPSDGDIASIFGLSFPPSLGGPFRFVDDYGADNIVKLMQSFNNRLNRTDFTPCELLSDYAKNNKKFFD